MSTDLPEWNSEEGKALREEYRRTYVRPVTSREQNQYGPWAHPFMPYEEIDQRLHTYGPPVSTSPLAGQPMYADNGCAPVSMATHISQYAEDISRTDLLPVRHKGTPDADRWYYMYRPHSRRIWRGKIAMHCRECDVKWRPDPEEIDTTLCFCCGEKGEPYKLIGPIYP